MPKHCVKMDFKMRTKRKVEAGGAAVADRWFKRDCFPTVMNALITAVIAAVVALGVDMVNPRARKAEKKDDLLIALAERLKGNVDSDTVEEVKRDVIDHLERAMRNYTTKDEFERNKNRMVDKEQGVVTELKMIDGHLCLVPVEPATNETESIKR